MGLGTSGVYTADDGVYSEKLIEELSFAQIGVVREEYAVSSDGMRMFGVMDLSSGFEGCRFAIGLRTAMTNRSGSHAPLA